MMMDHADRHFPERFSMFFEALGSSEFASKMAAMPVFDPAKGHNVARGLAESEVLAAAAFHGNIGERPVTLDAHARAEQGDAFRDAEHLRETLLNEGSAYRDKFGIKFLVSAAGKSGIEMLAILRARANNSRESEWATAREALWEIALKRLSKEPSLFHSSTFVDTAIRHKTTCAAAAIQLGSNVQLLTHGPNVPENALFEMASLSKMIGACFSMEYFAKHGISLETPVNQLLSKMNDSYRVPVADGLPTEWADELTLEHCMSHNGCNMHYVQGVPMDQPWVPIKSYIDGFRHNPQRVEVIFKPGTGFKYSGGGFILLQYLIEQHSGQPIAQLTRPFLDALGMHDFTFDFTGRMPDRRYVDGVTDEGHRVCKLFPPFAAGAFGSVQAMQAFQNALSEAYRRDHGYLCISHETARRMLYGRDRDFDFMGTKMGTGVFVMEGHLNKFMLHQGANDGYRVLNMHCFEGPDTGKGFVVVATGDKSGVMMNAMVAQWVIGVLDIAYADKSKFGGAALEVDGVTQENVVNMGYKQLVLSAFKPTRAEHIPVLGPLDELADFNVMSKGSVVRKTNDRFARAENMLSRYHPKWDPELFGRMGKVMDSWESVRHNQLPFDACVVRVPPGSRARFVYLSTKYHDGNQAPYVSVEVAQQDFGLTPELNHSVDVHAPGWKTLVPKIAMAAHSFHKLDLGKLCDPFTYVRVRMYPDGGFTRIGLYDETLPTPARADFATFSDAAALNAVRHPDPIAQMKKPLSMPFIATVEAVNRERAKLKVGDVVDVSSAAVGGKVLVATNQHYGAASNILNPFPPLSLFDALESSRSRVAGSSVEVVVQLAWPSVVSELRFEFTYLVNNSPMEMMVEASSDPVEGQRPPSNWFRLIARRPVKHYSAGVWTEAVSETRPITCLKVLCFPCGGFNRLRTFATLKAPPPPLLPVSGL